MIWQWEGDLYQVLLPTHAVFEALKALSGDRDLMREPAFLCRGAILSHKFEDYALQETNNGELFYTRLSFPVEAPGSGYKLEDDHMLPFHIMLLPLDKEKMPIAELMRDAYPDGDVIESGYLYCGDLPLAWPTTGLKFENSQGSYSVRDTAPDDLNQVDAPVYRKLKWVFINGCYVSMERLFVEKPTVLWKLLYRNGSYSLH